MFAGRGNSYSNKLRYVKMEKMNGAEKTNFSLRVFVLIYWVIAIGI